MATGDRNCVASSQVWVFFDRGLLDAAIMLENATGLAASVSLSGHARFHHQVFLTPPWPETHQRDSERQQELKDGIAEYHRLIEAFDWLGYVPVILPKLKVEARANFILSDLA